MTKILNQILLEQLKFQPIEIQPEWHDFKLEVAMDSDKRLYSKKRENNVIYIRRGENFYCVSCNGEIHAATREHKGGEFGKRYERVPYCPNCENELDYMGIFSDKNKRSLGNFIN